MEGGNRPWQVLLPPVLFEDYNWKGIKLPDPCKAALAQVWSLKLGQFNRKLWSCALARASLLRMQGIMPSAFGMLVQRNLKKTRKGRWVARPIGHVPIKQVLGPAVRGWWEAEHPQSGAGGAKAGV